MPNVEVFSAADRPVAMELGSDQQPISTAVYQVDGIERFQAFLSNDLPSDPDIAKRTALTRIGQLDGPQLESVRHAALGLAKASQYGLDRYPAIVFDGRAVLYGITSLDDALERYQQWQGPRPDERGVPLHPWPRFALAPWPAGFAATITTPQILLETTAALPGCLHWRPVGICPWLGCSPFGCSVETSLKVEHYSPDLVVSAYNELGGNPCWEIRLTLGLAQKVAVQGLLGVLLPVPIDSAGNRAEGAFDHRDHCNLAFREVDAIGHPLTSLSELAGDFGLLCESQTTPFVPYFQYWSGRLGLAPGGAGDSLSGQLHSGPARESLGAGRCAMRGHDGGLDAARSESDGSCEPLCAGPY